MSRLKAQFLTDIWVKATWEDYLQITADSVYEKAQCYYDNNQLLIEMSPIGASHARDNGIIYFIINLYCTLNNIPANGLIACSYRQPGLRECQPDLSYYLGENAQFAPQGTSIVNLETQRKPDLVIEISSTTLADDLGQKRLLYEQLEIPEYWVVDVENSRVIAFAIANQGSRQLTESQVLPQLTINFLQAALTRSHQVNQAELGNWLLATFPNLSTS